MMENLLTRSLRAYLKAGTNSWSGPLAYGQLREIARQSVALHATNPSLGRYFDDSCRAAIEILGRRKKLKSRAATASS
jgi:hypothetical protein